MTGVWALAALWLGLALIASLLSIWLRISTALSEIVVGTIAQLIIGAVIGSAVLGTDESWIKFLSGIGAIVLTFLAGAELDPQVFKLKWQEATAIGLAGFFFPFLGCAAAAYYLLGWEPMPSWLAGVAMSTTSVAVVYAVMLEFGFNVTDYGKKVLAACFINDLGTVLALGIVFAHYDLWLLLFGAVTAIVLVILACYAPQMFKSLGNRVSEPQTKFVSLILLALGGLASVAGSEAVLPAYLVGMALAPTFLAERELSHRMRIIAFSILTPFYFLKAGSLVDARAVMSSIGLITVFLAIKMATKFVGILPLTRYHEFDRREGMYTTLLMSTGLTFGSISALFGLTNKIINQQQYTILVTAVIGSAVAPTLIAQRWFQPIFKTMASREEAQAAALVGEEG